MKKIFLVSILGIVLIGASCNKSQTTNNNSTAETPAPPPAPTPQTGLSDAPPPTSFTPTPAPTPTPPPTQNFSVTADDNAATPSTITVKKGATVNLKLTVSNQNVYYGGLDFRSSVVNSGTILPGQSKTVTFTADKSFTINCFWPSSGVQKKSHIDVVVQ